MKYLPIPFLTLDDQWRFWDKVNQKSESECWLWTGGHAGDNGHGRRAPIFKIGQTNYVASRIAYYLQNNNHDPGIYCVLHECDNPDCMNNNHLWLGTQSDNLKDCFKKNRHSPMKRTSLTEKDILDIRSQYQEHMDQRRKEGYIRSRRGFVKKLAEIHNITPHQIHLIVIGQCFRHLL